MSTTQFSHFRRLAPLRRRRIEAGLAALAFLLAVAAAARPQGAPSSTPAGYHLAKVVPLGGAGFWDYMQVDAPAHRLYISHGTHVMIFDTATDHVVGDIPDTRGVHGIAIARRLGRGFISDGGADQVTIFSLKSGKTIGTTPVGGHNPDCIIYDPATRRVFTFNGRSDNSTAIDARTGRVVGTFDLGGRPEYAQPDGRGHIFNNLEDKSELLEIDARKLTILHRWPLAPCEHSSGMAMDAAHRRVFIGCENQMMAIVNADTGAVIAHEPIGRGVDANRFDPGTQLAFSSNGRSATLTVVHEDSPDRFSLLGDAPTQPGARTMALDTITHTIYEVTASFGPPAPAQNGRRRFPTMVPGSFRLLILTQ